MTKVGNTIYHLSRVEIAALRRIVKESGSRSLTWQALAARPKLALEIIAASKNKVR